MGRNRWLFAACFFLLIASLSWGQTCSAPVATATQTPPGAFQQVVAHITTSSGFQTKLSIVNLGATANSVVIINIRQDGVAIDSTSCTIPANGTLRLSQTSASNYPDPHWAIVGSSAPVGVNLFFELSSNGSVVNTVGFNDAAPRTTFTFPVEYQNSPLHTLGLAVANPNNTSNTVTVALLDTTGKILGTKSTSLVAFGQTAQDLLLTAGGSLNISSFLPAGNFIGSIQVTTSSPASVVGVGDDQGPFFSEAPMFVASSGGGGGGSTNISGTLVLSPASQAANIGSGSCTTAGVSITGARSTMTVVLSPNADPTLLGFNQVVWSAWVDAADHVTAQFCKFAKGNAFLSSSLTFNVRVITSSQASSGGTLTVPKGASIGVASCSTFNSAVPASATAAVAITPVGDPADAGLGGTMFVPYVSGGTVHAELCSAAFSGTGAVNNLDFNVAVLN